MQISQKQLWLIQAQSAVNGAIAFAPIVNVIALIYDFSDNFNSHVV